MQYVRLVIVPCLNKIRKAETMQTMNINTNVCLFTEYIQISKRKCFKPHLKELKQINQFDVKVPFKNHYELQ